MDEGCISLKEGRSMEVVSPENVYKTNGELFFKSCLSEAFPDKVFLGLLLTTYLLTGRRLETGLKEHKGACKKRRVEEGYNAERA